MTGINSITRSLQNYYMEKGLDVVIRNPFGQKYTVIIFDEKFDYKVNTVIWGSEAVDKFLESQISN